MEEKACIPFLVLAALVLASGCDHHRSSKYPGELGAPCSQDSDCQDGMLCTEARLPGIQDPFCYAPCANADSECPAGSLCGDVGYLDAEGKPGFVWICYRVCDTADFCRDLNPAFNACKTFGTTAQPICGIGG